MSYRNVRQLRRIRPRGSRGHTPAPGELADDVEHVPALLPVVAELGALATVDNGLDRQSIIAALTSRIGLGVPKGARQFLTVAVAAVDLDANDASAIWRTAG